MNTSPKAVDPSVSDNGTDYTQRIFQFKDKDIGIYRLKFNKDETGFRLDCPSGKFYNDITILQYVSEMSPLETEINKNVRDWIWELIFALEKRQLTTSFKLDSKYYQLDKDGNLNPTMRIYLLSLFAYMIDVSIEEFYTAYIESLSTNKKEEGILLAPNERIKILSTCAEGMKLPLSSRIKLVDQFGLMMGMELDFDKPLLI